MADHPVAGRFRAWLRQHALPVTPQRLTIAEIVLASQRHLSADDVAVELGARGSKAGIATVYRTLDLLVASGLAVECDFAEGFRRFEAAREHDGHGQLLCTTCGVVDQIFDRELDRLTAAAAEARGFERERYRLVIYGICRACRQGAAPLAAVVSSHAG